MSRKVFISFLGYSDYGTCHYCKDNYKSDNLKYVQEATLEYLNSISTWTENDAVYILLTKGAEEKNWVDNGHKDFVTKMPKPSEGLETRLRKLNLPVPITPVKDLPDGNNEEEIMQIFQRVFSCLQDDDELHFDLTHGFRYLPMLVLVLGNYARFLRNAKVKSITYGNFEGRDKVKNEAPLVDLCSLNYIQDWTYAAGQYVKTGNADEITSLGNAELKQILSNPALRDKASSSLNKFIKTLSIAIDDYRTCRGINIVKSSNISSLSKLESELSEIPIKPLQYIISAIFSEIKRFSPSEDVNNGYVAASWCYKNGLYQQAITILQENIITQLCIEEELNWTSEEDRDIIEKALVYFSDKTEQNNWKLDPYHKLTDEKLANKTEAVAKAIENENLQKIASVIKAIKGIRNDFNHSGIRNNPMKAEKLKQKVDTEIKHVIEIFNSKHTQLKSLKNNLFVNLTNHPIATWSDNQLDAAKEFGELVDYPFPQVQPNASEEDIYNQAFLVFNDILEKYIGYELTIHLMGEFTMTSELLNLFQSQGITCVASTTERIVKDSNQGKKEVCFKFVRFRRYGRK